jgi:hypothetical protein
MRRRCIKLLIYTIEKEALTSPVEISPFACLLTTFAKFLNVA